MYQNQEKKKKRHTCLLYCNTTVELSVISLYAPHATQSSRPVPFLGLGHCFHILHQLPHPLFVSVVVAVAVVLFVFLIIYDSERV